MPFLEKTFSADARINWNASFRELAEVYKFSLKEVGIIFFP